ncbi:MAG: hypothetical protein ACJ738_08250 [Gaiellales bacterium]
MSRSGVTALALMVAALLAASACGNGSAASSSSHPPPAVLPASAVPYLPSTAQVLGASSLAHQDALPAVADKLSGWGFRSAAQRTFQGQSKHLQIVVSRTVQFDSPAGARAYLDYLRANANSVYGVSTQEPQSNRGRSGVVVHPQACACHMAAATFMGLLQHGSRVSYLSLTGPKASASLLQQLETLAP